MKWNTKQVAVVAVLAIAGAAFCVDRFVVGYGPRSAAAAESTADIIASAQPRDTSKDAPPASMAVRTVSLSERVAAFRALPEAPDASVPDAFALPAAWIKLVHAPVKPDKADDGGRNDGRFVLTSVISGARSETTAACINGRMVRLGESIAGMKLVRVDHKPGENFVAVLEGKTGELRIPLGFDLKDTASASREQPDPTPEPALSGPAAPLPAPAEPPSHP